MKPVMGLIGLVFICSLPLAQTYDLGQNVFFNEEGAINLAVDAAVAVRNLDSPYVMFMLFMGADRGVIANVSRDNVLLEHNNQAYKMPTFKELRENYKQDTLDLSLYRKLGKDSLILSQMRYYRFQTAYDFFPARGQNVRITDEGEVAVREGFQTKLYFKNPGFKSGDTIIIKVLDTKYNEIWGAVAVEL